MNPLGRAPQRQLHSAAVRRRWLLVLAILSVAFAARCAAATWWDSRLPAGQRFVFGDSHSYWELARRVARGDSFQFGEQAQIFRTPGYPAVLAVLFRVWGSADPPVLAARIWGAVWGVAAVAATMGLARILADDTAALWAGAIAALQPEAIASSVFVLSEATFCLPMLLQLIAWAAAWQAARDEGVGKRVVGWACAAGVAAGFATLMRPGWLLFTPWAAVVLFGLRCRQSGTWRRDGAILAVTLVALALTMAPWWWRNYHLTGRFVATTLQVGASLYDGLSPDAQGGSDMRFTSEFFAAQSRDDAEHAEHAGEFATLFEERLDRRLRDASLQWAAEHPGRVLRLAGIKFCRLWNVRPNSAEMGGSLTRVAVAAAYLPLVALACGGVWCGWSRQPALVLCLLPIGYLTSLHVVFVSSIRYRQPAIFLLSVLAAVAIGHWRLRGRA